MQPTRHSRKPRAGTTPKRNTAARGPRSTEELRRRSRRHVGFWRDRLGLRDWHVDLSYCEPWEFRDNSKVPLGQVRPDYPSRTAWVKLLKPEATGPLGGSPSWERTDVEEVIVHELLHIHLGALGVSMTDYADDIGVTPGVLAEQVINALATCLVRLRRGER